VTWPTVQPQQGLTLTREASGLVRVVEVGRRAIRLGRDPSGLVVSLEDEIGSWALDRDANGDLVGVRSPWSQWSAERDPRGALRSVQVGSVTFRYRADASGRLVGVQGPSVGGRRSEIGLNPTVEGDQVRFGSSALLQVERHLPDATWRYIAPDSRVIDVAVAQASPSGAIDAITWNAGPTIFRRGPLDELTSIEDATGAWSARLDGIEGSQGEKVRLDDQDRPVDAWPPLGTVPWGVGRVKLTYQKDTSGNVVQIVGESGTATLLHDVMGRLLHLGIATATDGLQLRDWSITYDPSGEPALIDVPEGRSVRVVVPGGSVVMQGQDATTWMMEGPLGARITADPDGAQEWMPDPLGNPLFAVTADGAVQRVRTTPPGLPDHEGLSHLGLGGLFSLFPAGPLLTRTGALDPASGRFTGAPLLRWPWSPRTWPGTERIASTDGVWDGSTAVSWDPSAWDAGNPWGDPLGILEDLGVLAPDGEPSWSPRDPTAPLPWLPADLEGRPLWGPAPGSWPIDVDPVTAVFLRACVPPGEPLEPYALVRALLAPDAAPLPHLPDVPDPTPFIRTGG